MKYNYMPKYFIMIITLLLIPAMASGADYYVRPSGGNYGLENGTSYENAWDGFSNINWATVDAGNGKLFVAGFHREQMNVGAEGENGTPIQIVSCTISNGASIDDPGTISGADVLTDWKLVVGNIYEAQCNWNAGIVLEDSSPLTYLAWNTDIETTFSGASAGSFSYDNSAHKMYVWPSNNANPNTQHKMEVSKRMFGIYETSGNGYDYVTIDGLTVEGFARHGIAIGKGTDHWIINNATVRYGGGTDPDGAPIALGNGIEIADGSDYVTVSNSTIYGIFDSGVTSQASSNAYPDDISNIIFSNLNIYDCGMAGVEISTFNGKAVSNVTVSNVTIYNSGKGWAGDRGGNGIKVSMGQTAGDISGTIIEHSEIYLNNRKGISISEGGDVTVRYCSIHDNSGGGIAVWDARNPSDVELILHHNLIYNHTTGDGINFDGKYTTGGFTLYNNTFYNNGNDSGPWFAIKIEHIAAGATELYKNNIFYQTDGEAINFNASSVADADMDYNWYYRASGKIIRQGRDYDVLEFGDYQAATGQDANGGASDPLFINPEKADFFLQKDSPCINIGAFEVWLLQPPKSFTILKAH